jgi:hypothetical protein
MMKTDCFLNGHFFGPWFDVTSTISASLHQKSEKSLALSIARLGNCSIEKLKLTWTTFLYENSIFDPKRRWRIK